MLSKLKVAGAVSAISCLGVASAIAAVTNDQGTAPLRAKADTTAPVAEVSPDLTDNFVLFREKQAGQMPALVRSQIASSEHFGRNAALARQIDTSTGTGWVIPGDGSVCIAAPDPVDGFGTTCSPIEMAISRGLWIRLSDGKVAHDTLLAPDQKRVIDQAGDELRTVLGVATRTGATDQQLTITDR